MKKEFLEYLRTNKGYSENTTKAYDKDITAFANWATQNLDTPRWSTIKQEDIENYVSSMHRNGYAAETVIRRVSSLRTFYKWLQYQQKLEVNPARYVSTPKRQETLPETVTTENIKQALRNPKLTLTTKVMIAMMSETGIRVQEMLDLNGEDVDKTNRTLRIHGKGNRERLVYYGQQTANLLTLWMPQEVKGKLFWVDQRDVRSQLYEAMRTHPHALRHTFATAMVNNGASLQAIQQQLGHKSVKTTERYARMGTPQAHQQYLQFAPNY